MKRISFFLVLVFFLLSCATEKPDLACEKGKVTQLLEDFWRAFESKDLDRLSEIIAHDTDMVFFGTDENERWAGWEVVKEALVKQFQAFSIIRVQTHNTVIHVAQDGQSAWFSLQRYISVIEKDSVESGMKTRVSGVFEKRDGLWKLVQYHSSYPITDWDKFKY
jgi:uncharacterized protein (TIGR02246 family)